MGSPMTKSESEQRTRDILRWTCAEGKNRNDTAFELFITMQSLKNIITVLFRDLNEKSMNRVCWRYGRGEFTTVCPECGQTEGNCTGDCLGFN